jgi:hypothetical protein
MSGAEKIVMEAEIDFVLSAAEVAMTVTDLSVGTAAAAMYVVALPLAVCAESNEPQAPALSHVTDQFTPIFEGSFVTTAVIVAVAFTCKDEGGAVIKETEIARGVSGLLFPLPQVVSQKLWARAALTRQPAIVPVLFRLLIVSSRPTLNGAATNATVAKWPDSRHGK